MCILPFQIEEEEKKLKTAIEEAEKQYSDETVKFGTASKSIRTSSPKQFNDYIIARHSEANKSNAFVHSAGGGLAGSTKVSKLMPSAMRVAASMKVSMKD